MKFTTAFYCALAAATVSAAPAETQAASGHAAGGHGGAAGSTGMDYNSNTLDILGRGLGTVINYVIKDVSQIGQDAGVEVSGILRDVVHDVLGGNKRSLDELNAKLEEMEKREAHDIHHSLMRLVSDLMGAVSGIATDTGASLQNAVGAGSVRGTLEGLGL
ncbi:hypothetical protein FOB63_002239 [Clavispora lusitaniae]|uniref:uncharacterized protein n=1 Tax=Clavispora lusitaniae TaxID=36911 RepID=UPI00202C1F10|nr:hypothetical protein FOB63_002239 [Clavispora lusitaniae]